MMEMVQNPLAAWNQYWNGSWYPYLLLGAVIYLLIFESRKKKAGYLAAYLIIVSFVYFCPVTAGIIQRCIGGLVYWRVLWLLPTVPVIAAAFAGLLGRIRNSGIQTVAVIVCLVLVVVSGTSVWQAGNYEKVANNQKVPQEVAESAEIIASLRSSENALVAASNPVASYLRVYDPSIQLAFGRDGRGRRSGKNGKLLYEHLNEPSPDYRIVAKRAIIEKCEFVIFAALQEQREESRQVMAEYGYQKVAEVNNYDIFQISIDILEES